MSQSKIPFLQNEPIRNTTFTKYSILIGQKLSKACTSTN
jgi:hypothetical protein